MIIGKDMNGSQFFITLGTEPARELDRKHTLFGKVREEGMDGIIE